MNYSIIDWKAFLMMVGQQWKPPNVDINAFGHIHELSIEIVLWSHSMENHNNNKIPIKLTVCRSYSLNCLAVFIALSGIKAFEKYASIISYRNWPISFKYFIITPTYDLEIDKFFKHENGGKSAKRRIEEWKWNYTQ